MREKWPGSKPALLCHCLGAALKEPGFGIEDWKVSVTNFKATTAGGSATGLPAAETQISFLKGDPSSVFL